MEKMKKKMMQLWKDEEGATMVEYALMVALVALVAGAGAALLGGGLNTFFSDINTGLGTYQVPGQGS